MLGAPVLDLGSEDLQQFVMLSLFEPHQLCGLAAAASQAPQELVAMVKVVAPVYSASVLIGVHLGCVACQLRSLSAAGFCKETSSYQRIHLVCSVLHHMSHHRVKQSICFCAPTQWLNLSSCGAPAVCCPSFLCQLLLPLAKQYTPC